MTRMTFFALAAVGMIGAACERHPASELQEGHGGEHSAAADPHHPAADAHAKPVAATPAGTTMTAPATPAARPQADSSFFPASK